MRRRTKMSGLVSHTEPTGFSRMGEREVLKKKFDAGVITEVELRKLVTFLVIEKKVTQETVTIRVWGKKLIISKADYNKYCKDYGIVL